jgi:hypothetical protein
VKREHDETKLPRWAQNELRRLRGDLDHAKKRLSEGEESLVVAHPYSDAPTYLGDDAIVAFRLPTGVVRVNIDRGKLYLNGGDSFHVIPRAGNAIYIDVRRI